MTGSSRRYPAQVIQSGGRASGFKAVVLASLVGWAGSLIGVQTVGAGQLVQDTSFTAAIFQYIERSEYNIRWVEDQAVYKAANRAQNLRFTFFQDGFAVEPRDYGESNAKPWEMTLR